MIDWLPSILKSIREVGVAEVLREKVGLLDIQRAQAVGERDMLATQLAQAKAKIENLESDKIDLLAQLDDTRQQLQRLRQSNDSLPNESEKILVLIANARTGITSEQAISHFGLAQAKGKYFLDQLRKQKFIQLMAGRISSGLAYRATPLGREYLAQRQLL